MLVSHQKKFIYLKTMKTAGTSVEIFLERFCRADVSAVDSHATAECVSPAGIVGYRGPDSTGSRFYNHMPAARVRAELGPSVWDSYFRFCIIRNPFDKAVSYWWFRLPPNKRELMLEVGIDELRRNFNNDLCSGNIILPVDRNIYKIDDEVAVHFFIRYERLHHDIAIVCKQIGIERDVSELGQYKSGYRARDEHFSQYFDLNSKALVEKTYAWELSYFGYEMT